jgi:hypothetical protein
MSDTVPLKRLTLEIPMQGAWTMSEFAFLFRGRDRCAFPEQTQRTMRSWVAWFKELSANGSLRDGGHPLADSGMVVSGKQKAVHAGTHAPAGDAVGGYMLIEARDLAHAVEISKGCPILENGGSVEVRPVEQPKMQVEAG